MHTVIQPLLFPVHAGSQGSCQHQGEDFLPEASLLKPEQQIP